MKTTLLFALALVWSIGIMAQEAARETENQEKTEKLMMVPTTIDFQGRLHNSGGSPVSATLNITFALYTVASGGTAQWTEMRSVQVVDGLFQVKLGEVTPFNETHFSGTDRWLGIKVGSEAEMSPRTKFSSVGYAMQSIEWDPTWWEGGNPDSDIGRAGRVAIGTGDPTQTLDVAGTMRLRGHLFDYGNASGTTGQVLTRGASGVLWQNQWTNAGSNIYYNTGKVGIGTTSPEASLHVVNNINSGIGIYSFVSNDASQTYGGYFQGNSTTSRGVLGTSPKMGVEGIATGTTIGVTYGGSFESIGDGGRGIRATGPSIGVEGFSTSSTGLSYGGYFECSSSSGHGVYAKSPYYGVRGYASSSSGINYGGSFGSPSSSGRGVFGYASAYTGVTYGGYFDNNSTSGTAVFGRAIAASGSTYGGYFTSSSPDGTGVYGYASASSGYPIGVCGESNAPYGWGVFGDHSSNSGFGYGVVGRTNSTDGFSGYFYGGKFFVSGRAGIGAYSPAAGLHLKGAGFPDSFMYLEANTGQDAGFRIYEGTIDKWHIFNDASLGGLQIYNTVGTNAIFCKQSNSYVGIGRTSPAYKLDVEGSIRANSTVYSSDRRLKTQIQPIEYGLNSLLYLQGVSYLWNSQDFPERNFEKGIQLGFIAQELEQVIPELVLTDDEGYKSIDYVKIIPVIVEGMKELKAENDRLKQENLEVNARLERLEQALESLSER